MAQSKYIAFLVVDAMSGLILAIQMSRSVHCNNKLNKVISISKVEADGDLGLTLIGFADGGNGEQSAVGVKFRQEGVDLKIGNFEISDVSEMLLSSEVKYFVVCVEVFEIVGISSVECTAQDDFLLVVRNQLADVRDLDLFPKPKSSSWLFL